MVYGIGGRFWVCFLGDSFDLFLCIGDRLVGILWFFIGFVCICLLFFGDLYNNYNIGVGVNFKL